MDNADIAATFEADDYFHFYASAWSKDRDRSEVDEIVAALALSPGASVLDAPCGHGRLANELASRGFTTTGLDITEAFIEKARADAHDAGIHPAYVVGDIREMDFIDATFDAAISWGTSFGYFSDDENAHVLREYRRVLRPGGALLLETLHLAATLRRLNPIAMIRRGDDLMIDAQRYDVEMSRLERERIVIRAGEVRCSRHGIRLHAIPELRTLLEDAGFTHIIFSGRGGQELSLDTHRLVIVAR